MAKKKYFRFKRTGALSWCLFSALLSFAAVPHDVLSQDLEVEIRDLEIKFTELGIEMSRALADPTSTGQLDQYLQRFEHLIKRQHAFIQRVSKEQPAGGDKVHTTTGIYLERAGVIDGIEGEALHRSLLRPQELDAPSPMKAFLISLIPFTYSNHTGRTGQDPAGWATGRFFAGTALNFAASGLAYGIWDINLKYSSASPPIEYKYMFLATMALQRSIRALFKSARYLRKVFPAMDEGYKNMVRLIQAPRSFWRPVQEAGLPAPFDLHGVDISDYFEIERLLLKSLTNNNLALKLLDYQPFRSSAQTRLVEFFEDHIPETLKQGPRGRTLQSLERAAREGNIDPTEIVDQLSGFAEHEGRLDLSPLHLNDLMFWISTIGLNSTPTIRPVNAVSRQALELINNGHSREKFDEFISKLNGEKNESQANRGIEMEAVVEELVKAKGDLAGLAKLTLIFTRAGSEVAKFEYEICHGCKINNDALRTSDILKEGADSEDSWSKEFVKTISCSDMMARVSVGSRQ